MKLLADPRVEEFTALVSTGIEAWTRAGALLCQIVADNPRAVREIVEATPALTEEVLQSFLRIGRREVHPSLVLDGSPGAKRLALALPYDEQARWHRAKVAVMVRTASGPVEKEKRVCDLTKAEALRVIGDRGFRTVAEQRRMLVKRRGGEGGRTREARREHAPDGEVIEVDAEVVEPLDAEPREQLKAHLEIAHARLVEARSAMVMVGRREHPLDKHIAAALREIGQLRFAINEGEI